jgi:hypothetical protein
MSLFFAPNMHILVKKIWLVRPKMVLKNLNAPKLCKNMQAHAAICSLKIMLLNKNGEIAAYCVAWL